MLRVVEIAEDDRHLARDRGFLVVSQGGRELGRVPLADIAVILANAHGITFTANLVLGLAEVGAALVLCAANHSPAALVWPLDGHFQQTARISGHNWQHHAHWPSGYGNPWSEPRSRPKPRP